MKKTLLSSLMTGVMALTLVSLASVPAVASCPVKPDSPTERNCIKPMAPGECPKMKESREAKKAEFEARLKLTDSQKAQLEKIKTDERKALEPYKEKIKKEEEKLKELFDKEREIRTESMKKFDSMLNAEQKAELEKIKAEMKAEMENMPPKTGPMGAKGPMGPHHPEFRK